MSDCGAPREKLIAALVERHLGKVWWSGKSRVRVCLQHIWMLDKKRGGALTYANVLTEDLERMVYELDRGIRVEKDTVGKGQEMARVIPPG